MGNLVSGQSNLGPSELQASFNQAYTVSTKTGRRIYQVEGGFKAMSLLQAAAEWVKTGGKVHLLSTNQISRLLTLFKDAGANVKDIHASRIASGDLIRPSKMAEKVFQGRVNNQVINQDTVADERLKQGEIHAKEHESTTGLQSKSAREEKKKNLYKMLVTRLKVQKDTRKVKSLFLMQ